jgi:hypothetical protein
MGVFTTTGITAVATTAASAAPGHPSLARPAAAHSARVLSLTLPGTGVRLTSSLDDNGDFTGASAGDHEGDEVGVADDAVELGDDDDAAEPVETPDPETSQAGGSQGSSDDQGNADDQGDDQGDSADDQGDDNNDQGEADGDNSGSSSGDDQAGDDNSGSGSDNSGSDDGSSDDSGSDDGGSGD